MNINKNNIFLTRANGTIYVELEKEDFVKWLCENKPSAYTKEGAAIIYEYVCPIETRITRTPYEKYQVDAFVFTSVTMQSNYHEYNSVDEFCRIYASDDDFKDQLIANLDENRIEGCYVIGYTINDNITSIVVSEYHQYC